MRDEPDFRPFFTFKGHATVDGVAAVETWKQAFTSFLKKVSVTTNGKRLVLKSPVHTARVELLLSLFPKAQFVYVHRHPLVVLQSALNMAEKTYWYSYLQKPDQIHVHEFILNQFEVLFDAYEADKALIPPGNLVEVRFETLETGLVAEMERVYTELNWAGFDRIRPKLAQYAAQLHSYQKNSHVPLNPELASMARQRWARIFDAQGYDTKPIPQ